MIKLASLFQDGAVLQRDKDIPVWGKAAPGTVVYAQLDGVTANAATSREGEFMLYLPPHAAGGPFELTVTAGEDKLVLKDILIGEVWLASGQSNMEYLLSSDWRNNADPEDKDIPARLQEKQFNEMVMDSGKFRFFSVSKCASGAKETTCSGKWLPMTPENSGAASAVAAWFGLGLQYQLDVPVGLIISAWGGTIAEAWMSEESLLETVETRDLASRLRCSHYDPEVGSWEPRNKDEEFSKLVDPDDGNQGVGWGYADVDFDDSQWLEMQVSGSWKKQHIAGNGAVWFRKTVEIPESWAGKPLQLRGGAVDKHDISYFNGVEIGRTGEGLSTTAFNIQRCYDIDGSLVKAGKGVVAIRGFSFIYDGAVTGFWNLVNVETGEKISLNGIWQAKAEYDRGMVDVKTVMKICPDNPNVPSILFNAMLNPLIPYALRGAIWYQGESNASSPERSRAYMDILQGMIDGWRHCWRQPDMSFIMVQLAGFGKQENFFKDSPWALLRESQRLLALNDPDTFTASAIDIGEEDDIHPQNKLDVGKRLAMMALHHVYHYEEIVPGGPEILKGEVSGNQVVLTFKYAENLTLTSEEPAFFVAGKDGEFFAADEVSVKDDKVILRSDKVAEISQVRYAWADFPVTVLFNGAGFPASSFALDFQEK